MSDMIGRVVVGDGKVAFAEKMLATGKVAVVAIANGQEVLGAFEPGDLALANDAEASAFLKQAKRLTSSRMTDPEYRQRRGKFLGGLDQGQREDFEERAGIMEFCGDMERVAAEREAAKIILKRGA